MISTATTYVNMTNKNPKMRCWDCLEEITNNKFSYNKKYYCKECYNEARQACSWCKEKEGDRSDFIETIIEDGENQTPVTLCLKCIGLLRKCNYNNCDISFKNSAELVCELCNLTFCKVHVSGHRCSNREPDYLYRSHAKAKQIGDIEKAQFIKDPRCIGIELECVNGDPNELVGKVDRRIGITHDGSLKGDWALEIQTPPASSSELEKLIYHITKTLKTAEYKVNKSCGVHIHLDSDDFKNDPKKILNIILLYYAIEPLIYAMLPESRRNNKYSLPLRTWLDEPKILEMANKPLSMKRLQEEWFKAKDSDWINQYKHDHYDSSRYHGCNLHSLFSYGHLELRYHHGTLNPTKLINWINLHLLLVNWAINNFNKDVVNALFFTPGPQGKLRLLTRHLGIDRTLRRYVNRNLKKFKDIHKEDRD